jgi:hypothetical protein
MNNYLKLINYIFLTLITINLGFSSIEEFEFKLEFDHDFDNEDYTIECEIIYDSKEKIFEFDKDSSGDDLEYIKDFRFDLEVDCNKDVDDIDLYIYDENEDRIDKLNFEEDDGLEYTLNLVDKAQDWFEIEITDNFKEDNDCTLKVDEDLFDYEFNDDTDSKRLTIQKNYETDIKFICDEILSELEFTSFDSNENKLYTKSESDTKTFDFEKQTLYHTNILEVELTYNFETKSELKCDLTKNSETEEYSFTKSDTLKIKDKIGKEFKLSCNDKIEEIKIKILNDKNKELIEKTFIGKRIVSYELYLEKYLYELKIETNAKQTTYCTQILDQDSKSSQKHTIDSKQTNYLHKGSFEKEIDFDCTQKLDKVTLNIYPNDLTKTFEENSKNLLFSKTFGKDSTIDYILDKSKLNKIITSQTEQSTQIIQTTEKLNENIGNLKNSTKSENITTKLNITEITENKNTQYKQIETEILIIYICLGLIFLLLILLILKKLF